ncbi:hypothetical protein E2C01_055513 [Portunus trituberculatus]|uniref:Uncharacterized protein n=1 Tax=Portunus trituberculatus TaxID=210409 RepID=A0A5B7GMX6_PORTR|nr:hypothetical protein [Portunus trituberculatus]
MKGLRMVVGNDEICEETKKEKFVEEVSERRKVHLR